jgi:hypothetical protein
MAMALPIRSEIKEDILPLERVLHALKDAKASLKKFAESRSVELDPALQEAVIELQHELKKSRKIAKAMARRWCEIGHG